jgi:hypothetical protein
VPVEEVGDNRLYGLDRATHDQSDDDVLDHTATFLVRRRPGYGELRCPQLVDEREGVVV